MSVASLRNACLRMTVLPQRAGRWLLWLSAILALAASARNLAAQRSEVALNVVCAKEWCKPETALVVALDTLSKEIRECKGSELASLKWFVSAPISVDSQPQDTLDARGRPLYWMPHGARLHRLDRFGANPFELRLFDRTVTLYSGEDVAAGLLSDNTCLFVFSPPAWRGEDVIQIWMTVTNSMKWYFAEWFVILRHDGRSWQVVKTEIGMRN